MLGMDLSQVLNNAQETMNRSMPARLMPSSKMYMNVNIKVLERAKKSIADNFLKNVAKRLYTDFELFEADFLHIENRIKFARMPLS